MYLTPFIEELQELSSGVDAVDVFDQNGNRYFILKAIFMWCIHNFPAYGLVSRHVTKDIKDA